MLASGVEDGLRAWFFGAGGSARLVITPEMDGFLVYRADEDRSWVIPRTESVGRWLEEHEAEHERLTPLQREFRETYERALERALEQQEREAEGDGRGLSCRCVSCS